MSKNSVSKIDSPLPRHQNDGLEAFFSNTTSLDFRVVNPDTGELVEPANPTVQSERENCDINVILDRFTKTGQLPNENKNSPKFGDFLAVQDFKHAMDTITTAQSMFLELPAPLRAKFDNDPKRYVDFVLNPDNVEEAYRLGLVSDYLS